MGTPCMLFLICLSAVALDPVSSAAAVRFGPSSGSHVVREDYPTGRELFPLEARNVPNNTAVTFEIVKNEDSNLIRLCRLHQIGDTWKVKVLLSAALDRDGGSSTRTLKFKATVGESKYSGTVTLAITDVNDNPPKFVNTSYTVEVDEGSSMINQNVATFEATDPDDGQSGSVYYTMEGDDDAFQLTDTFSGHVKLMRALDYETKNEYHYTIHAKDKGNPVCPGVYCKCNDFLEPGVNCAGVPAELTIKVKDVQDSPPVFQGEQPFRTEVNEDAPAGTEVFTMTAVDGDSAATNPSDITYRIDGPDHGFKILSDTGVVEVKDNLETNRTYKVPLIVKAIETGQSGRNSESTVLLTIVVNNKDDQLEGRRSAAEKDSPPSSVGEDSPQELQESSE